MKRFHESTVHHKESVIKCECPPKSLKTTSDSGSSASDQSDNSSDYFFVDHFAHLGSVSHASDEKSCPSWLTAESDLYVTPKQSEKEDYCTASRCSSSEEESFHTSQKNVPCENGQLSTFELLSDDEEDHASEQKLRNVTKFVDLTALH